MNKFTTKIGVGIATAALLAMSAGAAFAADATISDTGNGSTNIIVEKNKNTTNVSQSNITQITVGVNSSANSGGNKNIDNNGGDSTITIGKTTSDVNIVINGSSNTANVSPCGCNTPSVDPMISDTGNDSTNKIVLKNKNKFSTTQSNITGVDVLVDSKAKSGKNKNIGNNDGNSTITIGKTKSIVNVLVNTPSNVLNGPTPTPII